MKRLTARLGGHGSNCSTAARFEIEEIPTARVYTVEIKCPGGHPLAAAAGLAEGEEDARSFGEAAFHSYLKLAESGETKGRCMLCGGTAASFGVESTDYLTLDEAVGPMSVEMGRRLFELGRDALFRHSRN